MKWTYNSNNYFNICDLNFIVLMFLDEKERMKNKFKLNIETNQMGDFHVYNFI